MGSPIQHTSMRREMHACIILLRPLLLVLSLFISRFISGFGCRCTRSALKNGMPMWSSETAWTVLHHIIQYTHYTYTLISFTTEKKITLSTDATATAIVAAAFAVAMISHAFDAQVSTDKMNISNLCVFFSSSPVCLFVCLFCWQFPKFFVHLANLNIQYINMQNVLSHSTRRFWPFVSSWFIYRWDWMIAR